MIEPKTPTDIVRILCREIVAYGKGWRWDWSDFDGRTLRDQLNTLATWADNSLERIAAGDPAFDHTDGSDFFTGRKDV